VRFAHSTTDNEATPKGRNYFSPASAGQPGGALQLRRLLDRPEDLAKTFHGMRKSGIKSGTGKISGIESCDK
jgi:hypothetical protein